jgi:hypothetical protein
MALFDDIWEQLFPEQPDRHPVAVKEALVRSAPYLQQYEEWKSSSQSLALISEIEKAYYKKRNQVAGFYQIHLLQSGPANGFALSYHPEIGEQAFKFLFDYWRDRMLNLGYQLKNTDRHTREMPDHVQTTEKHYLKPPVKPKKLPINQQYGNVLLEHVQINRQPSFLKVQVNIYADHLYTEAHSFDDLVAYLFSEA